MNKTPKIKLEERYEIAKLKGEILRLKNEIVYLNSKWEADRLVLREFYANQSLPQTELTEKDFMYVIGEDAIGKEHGRNCFNLHRQALKQVLESLIMSDEEIEKCVERDEIDDAERTGASLGLQFYRNKIQELLKK